MQKYAFFLIWLNQNHGNLGDGQFYRQSWKTGPCSNVGEPTLRQFSDGKCEDALPEMRANDLFWFSNRRQGHSLAPRRQQIHIVLHLQLNPIRQRAIVLLQNLPDCCRRKALMRSVHGRSPLPGPGETAGCGVSSSIFAAAIAAERSTAKWITIEGIKLCVQTRTAEKISPTMNVVTSPRLP